MQVSELALPMPELLQLSPGQAVTLHSQTKKTGLAGGKVFLCFGQGGVSRKYVCNALGKNISLSFLSVHAAELCQCIVSKYFGYGTLQTDQHRQGS